MKPMPRRLAVEPLEDRCNPVVWNNPWADPGHLTISFAPDGTPVRTGSSDLFADLLPARGPVWQREALRAFQTWAAQANINLAVVPDTGVAFGTPGPIQGDPRHGDIRLGATNLGTAELAATTPFDLFGGWSGSVLLNTTKRINVGGTAGAADLYTVLLQEAGHAFGVGNSIDPDSAMYEQYQGPRAGISAGDMADIHSLYGARTPDQFEGKKGNDTPQTATPMSFAGGKRRLVSTGVPAPVTVSADLTTAADVDVYSLVVPAGMTSLAVALKTAGISLLTAKLTVTDAAGNVLGSAAATDPTAGDLLITVPLVKPGATYFVRVEKAADDVFGIGAYQLTAGTVMSAASLLNGSQTQPKEKPSGTVNLGNQQEGADRRWDYTLKGTLAKPTEVDGYAIHTKKGTPSTLVVAVWGLQPGGLSPVARVYDSAGHLVPAQVLTDEPGVFTLQVTGVKANTTYTVRVSAADPTDPSNTGDYYLGIDFRSAAIASQTFAADTLTASRPAVSAGMTVTQSELLHFALATVTADATVRSAAQFVILDHAGREVFRLFANAGQTVSGDVLLGPGNYTLIVAAGAAAHHAALPALGFSLTGLVRNDPIGVGAVDPSGDPSKAPAPPPPTTTGTGTYTGPYTNPYRPG